jgi:hypothetical protein
MLGVATEEMPMNDLAKWNVHGPVQTLRIEHVEWDLSLEQWQTAEHFTLDRFHPGGRIGESESHNRDGSISRSSYAYDAVGRMQEAQFGMNGDPISKSIYSYDESGRLMRIVNVDRDGTQRESEAYSYGQDGKRTKVYFVPKQARDVGFSYGIEGTEMSYGATGAATITTRYEHRGQPDEVLFHDEDQSLLRRVIFTRDSTGRLMSEEMHLGEEMPFPDMEKERENAPEGARKAAAAAFAKLLGAQKAISSTTYKYDGKGRLLERRMRMWELGDHRTTFRYDNHDNPVEESIEDTSREMQIDEGGNLRPTNENTHIQHMCFEYRYDARGNWTERVVWSRLEPNPNFQRSNVARREITYYGG